VPPPRTTPADHAGFKVGHGRFGKQLRTARARVAQLFEQRRDVPKRVEVRDFNHPAQSSPPKANT
jgi:hypothetical protein